MDDRGSHATSFAEAEALSRKAAQDLLTVKRGMAATASLNPETDRWAANAASPTWVGGFDERLGVTRTTS